MPAVALAALAACGSPATTTIELETRAGWTGSAEALVHHSDGSLASRAPITGSSLDVAVDDGDTVTVALHDGPRTTLLSYMQLAQGDHVHAVAAPSGPALRSVDVHLPTVEGADAWIVSAPGSTAYGDAGTSNTISIDLPAGVTSSPILAVPTSNGNPAPVLYGAPSAAIGTDGITVTDVVDSKPMTIVPTGVPDGAQPFVGAIVQVGHDELTLMSDQDIVQAPTHFGDALVAEATLDSAAELVGAESVSSGTPPDQVSLDLSAPAVPHFTNATIKGTKVSWTATGGGDYDITYAGLGAGDFMWMVAVPPGTSSFTLPSMPSDLAAPSTYQDTFLIGEALSDAGGYHDLIGLHDAVEPGATFQFRGVPIATPSAVSPRLDRGKLELRAGLPALRR